MDGGLTALGGFLFQTVGSFSLKAASFQEYHDAPSSQGDLETLLGFVKDGEVRYEDQDQDASIREILHGEQAGYILVQFKYSSLSPRPSITAYEMRNIISRLQASEARAKALGQQVTGYSLLTNRPLNADAQRLIAAHSQSFYVTSSLPERIWEEQLRQFARRLSCSDIEIESGIRRGIGELLLRVSHPRYYGEPVITSELLIEMFTGCQAAQAITPEIVAVKSLQQLNRISAQPLHFGAQPLLVRPHVQKQLADLVEVHAFVVLSGIGGNGKTATLWQWMQDCFTSELPQKLGTYYSLSTSQSVQEDFLAHLFGTWANVPTDHPWRHLQTPEQFLDRLETARTASMKTAPSGHPIFVLGLDAVDETFQTRDRRALSDLLMWFWEQEVQLRQRPRATLIVTCRDSSELAEHWLSIISPFMEKPQPFRDIEVIVDEFTASELVTVAYQHLPTLAERFEQTYRTLDVQQSTMFASSSLEATSVLHAENPSSRAVDADVFQALRHPALWSCLLNVDGTIQARVLDGDVGALGQLASRFLRWFCQKVRARGRQARDEDVIKVLQVIAKHCDPRLSPRSKRKDWIAQASSTSYMTVEMADAFYGEALSAGLILRDTNGRWRWRHPFLGVYLASHSLSEEDEQ